jgi:ABC-type branched-subunit amino acid transport system permease subunit
MELHERLVSAVLGALWGAVLGVMAALLLHYTGYRAPSFNFSITYWKNMIVGCSGGFAILGFIFKSSIGGVIGTLMNLLVTDATRNNDSDFLDNQSFWVKALVVCGIATLVYWLVKD